jgi:hypothetical protein
VIADRRWNAGVPCTALKNAPGIGLAHRAIRQKPGAPEGRAKKWTLAIVGEAGGLNAILQISLKMMVTRHAMFLATFFVQTDPQSAVLPVDVRDSHTQRRTDAGEGENEKADQRTVAEADHGCGVDAVEELARFRRRQYGGLAGADNVFGTAHRSRGIYCQDLADHQPVEQHADSGQPLFDGRRRNPRPRLSTQAATCTGAMTQNNLGTALADLGQRTRDTSEICQALSDYVSAWQVFSGAAPYDASIAAGGAKTDVDAINTQSPGSAPQCLQTYSAELKQMGVTNAMLGRNQTKITAELCRRGKTP